MAEAVLFNVADGIIEKLGSLVLKEIALWRGIKDDLDKLKGTVFTIKAVLLDAEEQYMESNQVKTWLGMLKEAIYDADDLLDEFSLEAMRQQMMTSNGLIKGVRIFFSNSNRCASGLKMAHKIKDITSKLDKIAADRKFLLEERPGETLYLTRRSREQTHSSAPEVVIGREHDKEAIIEHLVSSNVEQNVSVLSIVGLGGLGKTTLAQLVYNDDRVKMHFELKAWACIADNFDVELTVRKIIESASRQKPRNSEMDALKNLLHDIINGKKFLIVLDDLWSDDFQKWSCLRDLLAGGARGSKVVITTRLRKVAEVTRPISIYELKGLSEIESWSLFKQVAFKRRQLTNLSNEAIGKEIVAKCMGVPLAIKTIGGLLYFKDAESEWLSFKNKELSKVNQNETDILPTLKLSYNHLPSHFKHCFAYCSLFPKDCKIDVKRLIQLWMAQGYVKSSDPNYQGLEDTGVEYFMDLLQTSFFQEVEKDVFGNIETCKMHDLLHDLAMLVAGSDCTVSVSSAELACIDNKTQHISVKFDGDSNWQAFSSLLKASKARTLLLSGEKRPQIREEQCHELFCSLRCLRVLDLSYLRIKTVPRSIYKLKHLRYLDLSKNNEMKTLPDSISKLQNLQVLNLSWNRGIKTLPDSITKLKNLQVLNLEGCKGLTQLPKNIKKLVNLSHLNNDFCNRLTHMPCGIGQLTRLRILSTFVVAKSSSVSRHLAGLSQLHALNNLRGELTIENLRYIKNAAFEFKAANLKEKQHLQALSLCWNSFEDDNNNDDANDIYNDEVALEALRPHQNLKGLGLMSYRGVKSATWLSSLTNLVSICFKNCKNIQHLPPFDKLPALKRLWIFTLNNLEYIDTQDFVGNGGSASFFPSLTNLHIFNCPNLKGFRTARSATASADTLPRFQYLSVLAIENCPDLTLMPLFPSLENFILGKNGFKSLENILKERISSTSSLPPASSYSALSQLKSLVIEHAEEHLPDELLQNLTSLQYLHICFCPMKTLFSEDKDDAMQWQCLQSLHSLFFQDMPNLVSLPLGLQHVTTLRHLLIQKCPKLMSLTEEMSNLPPLQSLFIAECPQLSERYKNNMAEDWPKIAHIPYISIDYRTVQSNGCYEL